jgi:Uma2 family endonuclease
MTTSKEPVAPGGRNRLTGEEYARRDCGPSELVRGKVVAVKSAHFSHGKLELRIAKALAGYAIANRLGEVAVGEVGVYTERCPDTVRGADVVFISNERLSRRQSGFLDVPPELVVEAHGRNESRRRLERKLLEYFACGVQTVWVAEPRSGRILIHRSPTDVHEVPRGEPLTGGDVLPGFVASVAELLGD